MPTASQLLQPAGTYGTQTTSTSQYLQPAAPTTSPNQNTLQVTANPMDYTSFTQPVGATDTSSTSTTATAPTYDPEAAARAERIATANSIRGSVRDVIDSIYEVYNNIYSDVDAVGKSKAVQINDRFGRESRGLTEEFNEQFPRIGSSYAARGAGSSSYRQRAEGSAINSYGRAVDELSLERDDNLATVGEFVSTEQAQIKADQEKLGVIATRIAESEDPDELMALKTEYQNLKADLTAKRAGLQSRDAYTAQANTLVSTEDRTATLRQGLGTIIAGAAPTMLKKQVGQTLITQSGLSAEEQQMLMSWFNGEVDKTVTPTTA